MPTATAKNNTTKNSTATKSRKPAKKLAAVPAPPVRVVRGQVQIRLPQPLIDRLDDEAERRCVSKTFLVEQMLASSIERWEDQEIEAI